MTIIKREHQIFYLQGRQAKLPKVDLDEAEIAKAVYETGTSPVLSDQSGLRQTIYDHCRKAVSHMAVGRRRRGWVTENAEPIRESGGDEDGAYGAWLAGVTDELAYGTEEGVLAELGVLAGEEDEDEDEDEEDEDEDEGDDTGGDDDEEEDEEPVVARPARGPRR